MKTRHKFAVWRMCVALAAPILISACGGGNDNTDESPPATAPVPAVASQSSAGFIAYLQELVASSADTQEPVDTSTVTAQTDETGEPVKVD